MVHIAQYSGLKSHLDELEVLRQRIYVTHLATNDNLNPHSAGMTKPHWSINGYSFDEGPSI